MKISLDDKLKKLLLKDEYGIQHRLLNIMLAVTFLLGGISVIISLALEPPYIGNYSALLIVLFVGLCLWISAAKGNIRLSAWLLSSVGSLVLLPLLFITNGGAADGIHLWYIVGLITPLIALKGKSSVIMFLLSVIEASLCIVLEIVRPELIFHPENDIAAVTDVIISFIFFCIIIGFMFRYQTNAYEKQSDIMMKKDRELVKAMENAQTANSAKSRFLAHMSHEIRTPINAVLGMDEMIIRESNDKDITSYAVNIRSAGNSLLTIINDILDFSKIESNKMEIVPTQYDLSLLLRDCYNMVFMRAADKGLKFSFETDVNTPKFLVGDEFRIRQIIINLLTNGVKYTPSGSVSMSVGYEKSSEDKIMLIISVKDTGMGISDEDKAKIFDSFRRISGENTKNIEGTGLGLAITKKLTELMKGTILVESEYGRGSNFTVRIPQNVASEGVIGRFDPKHTENSGKKYRERFHAPDARILVVDDVKMNVEVMRGLIKKTLITSDAAYSGSECLDLAAKNKYDLIFMDHIMPEMDGVETLNRLKSEKTSPNTDTPVIALTANAIVGAKENYISLGFSDYLSKPVKGSDLEDMLIKFLPAQKVIFSERSNGTDSLGTEGFLNTAEGISFCGGDSEFYREILGEFSESGITERLGKAFSADDMGSYGIYLHRIMGMALSIGADVLARKTADMSNAVKCDNYSYIKEHHKSYIECCEKLTDRIKQYLKENGEA